MELATGNAADMTAADLNETVQTLLQLYWEPFTVIVNCMMGLAGNKRPFKNPYDRNVPVATSDDLRIFFEQVRQINGSR